jgi:hypothetical protein
MRRFLPTITGLALVAAGIAAIRYDKSGAALYGFPTKEAEGLGMARAAGARDIVMGAMLLAAPKSGRNLLFAVALVSILDVANVNFGSDEPNKLSLAVHASGIFGALVFAMLTPTEN